MIQIFSGDGMYILNNANEIENWILRYLFTIRFQETIK